MENLTLSECSGNEPNDSDTGKRHEAFILMPQLIPACGLAWKNVTKTVALGVGFELHVGHAQMISDVLLLQVSAPVGTGEEAHANSHDPIVCVLHQVYLENSRSKSCTLNPLSPL